MPNNTLRLNLNRNLIAELSLFSFENLKNLTDLDLSHNEIVKIHPLTFHSAKRLKHIDLSYNNITRFESHTFIYASALHSLNLGYNPLEIENEDDDMNSGFLVHTHLKELVLDGCNLEIIPRYTFNNLTSLQSLSLADNPISEVNLAYIGLFN